MMAGDRKRGAPMVPRADCPACHRKGLGNVYPHRASGGTYRQCTYCQEAQITPPKRGDDK